MIASGLGDALGRLATRSASAVVARSRIASPALNAALLRRLSAQPGDDDSLLADPVFEAARIWRTADASLGELAGNLLHPGLVDALDLAAADERMPRDRRPYRHQYDAWVAARDGLSFLVTAGTGSGKTECFMIPMLDGLLRDLSPGRLGGIRAIIIYPLNALIESQRERLAAWTEHLKDHLSFAMYSRLTPESRRGVTQKAAAELADRQSIRETPPSIMVTNITMLEYLLLRAKDRSILERSQGQLRWIVLDEAHSYAGAQAAEMALLLRRVRAAFGVSPEQVQLMATSATISDGADTKAKLERFVADLGGHDTDRVRVIEGAESQVPLPSAGRDEPLAAARLTNLDPSELWATLAPHPRIRQLRGAMQQGGIGLQNAARLLFGSNGVAQRQDMQTILDAAALATAPGPTDERPSRLLPWRVSLFHRALGGVWACIDPDCPHRDPELAAPGSGWFFGGVWLRRRDRCKCEAPSFEVVLCNECGTPHLRARCESGMVNRLVPMRANELDEFLVDAEPDLDGKTSTPGEEVLLRPAYGGLDDRFVNRGTGELLDNGSPEDAGWTRLQLIEDDAARGCCKGAHEARLAPVRYGPAFFLGNTFPILLEALASPMEKSGLPSGGRRSLSFSDSRQGTARLAAKLQQESERSLTRAFLYHTVQERRGPDPEERALIERRLEAYRRDPIIFAENIEIEENKLKAQAEPVPWDRLVEQFASQSDLRDFAGDVWQERMRGGRQMAEEPAKLAEMFLYRELFRRPKVQNNPETMGLLRLVFPVLEQRARANTMPSALREAGVDSDGWIGLVAAAIDFGFRDNLAVDMPDAMVRWVAPRGGALQGICAPGLALQDRAEGTRAWPTPKPLSGNPSRLVRLVYALTGGDWDNRVDQDRASEVLSTLWRLITESATRDVGRGAYRLDFRKAAITRLEKGWLCPVTRRIFGYAPGGRSPYDAARPMENVRLPILPIAKPGGLDPAGRAAIREWCAASDDVAALRAEGLWTNVHDRVAEYPSFLRAQEHSAQIPRPVLRDYEAQFKDGRINVLNCTTTMEMGVDIPDVTLVVNGNVPPSISNYRQRIGRAGRRGEPFAFAATFCRDLPWDESAFDDPSRYLRTAMAAPAVRLDSPSLVARHVNAALLGAFLRSHSESVDPRSSTGAFFGACDDVDAPISADAAVQSFLTWLRGDLVEGDIGTQLAELTRGTALEGRDPLVLAAATAEALEVLLARWGAEYGELLSCAVGALDPDVKAAFANRAKRMRGEFLLGELARRGFTPAYGFPVDVVQFDHLSGHHREHDDAALSFGEPIGAPSRTLDVAIREYAPGAEVVVDGLVHLSEGVLPAWRARADASGLEDLQLYWECSVCRAFGVSRLLPELCPACATPQPRFWKTLRPAGFLGRRAPHTGYENLGHVPYETSRVQASGTPWRALPDQRAGRLRANPVGQVVTLSAGPNRCGYALCLLCGRAEAETEENVAPPPLSEAIRKHKPLANSRETKLVKGFCPGGWIEPQRIQRHIRLVHAGQTDVFEWQMPPGTGRPVALALAAALREAIAERLAADAREIGVATGPSEGPAGDKRISLFLHDRAAQGAGLVTRLVEMDVFRGCLLRAAERLECQQDCDSGCPACVLRPDLSHAGSDLDRRGGHDLALIIIEHLELPPKLRVFGSHTRLLGGTLPDWLERQSRTARLSSVAMFLHGAPADWDLAAWPVTGLLARLKEAGVAMTLVISAADLFGSRLDLSQRLDLYRLAGNATLARAVSLPMVGSSPVLALVTATACSEAVAAPDVTDSIPGAEWGQGGQTVIVRGPAPPVPAWQPFDASRLVAVPSGNAWLLRLSDQLDGPVSRFGRGFWDAVDRAAPALVATMRTQGVRAAQYTDRYLATPLAIRLLREVLLALPGGGQAMTIAATTARLGPRDRTAAFLHDGFPDDELRRRVLQALLPGDSAVAIRPKAELPHARRLRLELTDGRSVTLLLDQGFGAWRSAGSPRHDFQAEPARQAQALRTGKFDVRVEPGSEAPMIVEFGDGVAEAGTDVRP